MKTTPPTLRRSLLLDEGTVVSLVGAGGKTSLLFRLARELAAAGRILITTTTRMSVAEVKRNGFGILFGPAEELIERAEACRKEHFCWMAARAGETGKLLGFQNRDIERLWQAGVFDWIVVEADGAARRPLKAPGPHEPVIPDCCRCVVGVAGLTALGKPLAEQWVFRVPLFARLTGLEPGARLTARAIADSLSRPDGIFKGSPPDARQLVFLNQAEAPARREAGQRIAARLAAGGPHHSLQRAIVGQLHYDPPVVDVFDF